ncbi:MAG: hypothetical protein A2017_00740 [Lentisphaerae bacterium GWF2_44_16]|nr:MAG: hypothetical protein A2017_00740 [Lentisphaerae bacterium GWF2_44_16]
MLCFSSSFIIFCLKSPVYHKESKQKSNIVSLIYKTFISFPRRAALSFAWIFLFNICICRKKEYLFSA